ncbi:hypothetical protein GWI34_41155, partial [Actinomadura sp. DSM 109109]|nr:hypothetical protein [Actinomadura lepetitiana]
MQCDWRSPFGAGLRGLRRRRGETTAKKILRAGDPGAAARKVASKRCEARARPLRLSSKPCGIDSRTAAPYGWLCEGHQLDPMNESNLLLSTFMQRRASLLRYFAARVGEAEAEDLVQE